MFVCRLSFCVWSRSKGYTFMCWPIHCFFLLGCRLVSSLAKLALWFVCVLSVTASSDQTPECFHCQCFAYRNYLSHMLRHFIFSPQSLGFLNLLLRLALPPPSVLNTCLSFSPSPSLSPSLSPFSLSFLPPSLLFSPVFHSYPPLYLGQAGLCYEACSGHMKPGLLEGGGFADSLPCVFVCLCVCVFVCLCVCVQSVLLHRHACVRLSGFLYMWLYAVVEEVLSVPA